MMLTRNRPAVGMSLTPQHLGASCHNLLYRPMVSVRAHRRHMKVLAGAEAEGKKTLKDKVEALVTPFSNPEANKKMLSLATAQMLCSVATLIHDTYLPVYMSDVLHMSNSKIGNLQAIAQFLSKASGSVSGVFADILSPARMVIFGTLLTTINKPMFAASGVVYSTFGAVACLYWIDLDANSRKRQSIYWCLAGHSPHVESRRHPGAVQRQWAQLHQNFSKPGNKVHVL